MDEANEKPLDLNASDVEACRICLGTDIKLHSLQDTALGTCLESIGGFTKSFEGQPNFVCYECAPTLIKCNKLIQRSQTADLALLEIFNKNGQINKQLIEEKKKSEANFQSSLDSCLLLNYFHIKYDDDTNTAESNKIGTDPNENNMIPLKNEIKDESEEEATDSEIMNMFMSKLEELTNNLSEDEGKDSDSDVEAIEVEVPVIKIESDDENMGNDFIKLKTEEPKMNNSVNGLANPDQVPLYNRPKKIKPIGLIPKEKGKKKKNKSRPMNAPAKSGGNFGRQRKRYFNMQVENSYE